MKLSREEQETIITFNAKNKNAILYTRDPTVMREVDSLDIVSQEDYQRSRRIKLKKEWLKSICTKYDHKFGCKFWGKYLEKMRKVVYNVSTRI